MGTRITIDVGSERKAMLEKILNGLTRKYVITTLLDALFESYEKSPRRTIAAITRRRVTLNVKG